jgi:pilus assembly protein CpaB
MAEIRDITARLRRTYLRHRRLGTAGLAAVAVVSAVHVLAPEPPRTTPLVVAAHDLASGRVIAPGDLQVVQTDPDLVPAGAATNDTDLLGRVVAGPMNAGEPVTDRRVLGAALIAGYPLGLVAAPIRIQDPDVVALLRVGDRIDIYASTGDPDVPALRVVSDVAVVALPTADPTDRDGALVVLAVTQADAARLAQASATTALSVSLRG